MNIYKNKFLSRFGLMHMIATNLCVWLNVLILETSHEILHGASHHGHATETATTTISSNDSLAHDEIIARHLRDANSKSLLLSILLFLLGVKGKVTAVKQMLIIFELL